MTTLLRKGDLNYSITLIKRNLLILHSAQRPHNPVSAVRLLYGERLQKRKPRRSAFSQYCKQQFDIPLSHRSRPSEIAGDAKTLEGREGHFEHGCAAGSAPMEFTPM